MHELTDVLMGATAHIGPEYFCLTVHGGGPVYRERVYCYELYHQMRLRWPIEGPFQLSGEVDKTAHPILSQLGASYAKPDLLVHGPGDMGLNHAIVEVKSLMARPAGIRKDLKTLALFRADVGYARAIYLIYRGEDLDYVCSSPSWASLSSLGERYQATRHD
jgi:hypothetical protein